MKRGSISIKINLPDSFTLGKCDGCPFKSVIETETSYQQYERTESCKLGFTKFTCPIELNEESKSNQVGFC